MKPLTDVRQISALTYGFTYEGMRRIERTMRGERIFPDKGFYEGIVYSGGGVGGEAFSRAQHAGSLGPARLMARRVDLSGATRFLDVGGGSGAYTLSFLQRNPGLRATILDFPQTAETAKRYAAAAGMSDRVTHIEGNALTTDWPPEQDVVLMSCHRADPGPVRVSSRRMPAGMPSPPFHAG